MVSLSDIPFVGAAFDKISEATVEAVIRGLRYMLCYKSLMNDLNSEIEKVKNQEERVARKIVEAKDDGKIIEKNVVEWQGKVENVKIQADELTRQTSSTTCFKVLNLPNPVSRFRLGRKAAHLAKTVIEHTDSGKELLANEIAHYAPDDNVPISDTLYQSFASRQEAYEKLWNALVNNNGHPIIGIYGMAGVGKTRMMEKAWEEVKDKKIFDKVTRANVGGEKLDVLKLQDQLAGYLNCHLESKDNEVQRASQLTSSLMNGGKVLVILDDVWDVIPLNRIGIPFGDGSFKGCKILMTSRKDTVCRNNNCIDPIQIKPLTDGEAWEMFRTTVGTSKIESLHDSSLAEKVCKECGALPLLIGAVGSALKNSTENSWKDALYQLENCRFDEIDGMDPRVYNGIKFSFEKLAKGERACLLLCSFFPEDDDIDMKRLFEMATGCQLLESGRNIGGLVDNLKSSSLLLEGRNDDYVKVHDIIRDVARSIATRDPVYAFLSVRCRSRLPDTEEDPYPTRRLLHLDLEGKNVGFPDDMFCPDLHTLWMQSKLYSQQLSSGFFNAFVNLKVLVLQGEFLFDHQLTIHDLKRLRVLILENCEISQAFISSVSKNLEILCIQRCDLPSPVDLPELKNLRKLEILDYSEIEIVEKAISRLSSIEELIVPYGFKTRGDDDDKSVCWEISELGCLRNLVIQLRKLWQFPDRDIFSNLVEFSIQVGPRRTEFSIKRKYVGFEKIHIERWWMALLERAEKVLLQRVSGLPINGLSDSNMGEAFGKLKEMTIRTCHEIQHVASWEKGRNQRLKCFTNLTYLQIWECKGLKYVFSYSVAKCLLQLQRLVIRICPTIEEIIRVEDDDDDDQQEIICFPNLQTLTLYNLRSLKRFCRKKVTFGNITGLSIDNVNNTKAVVEEIVLGSDHYLYSKLKRLSLSSSVQPHLPPQLKLQLQNVEGLVLRNCWWPGNSLFNGSLTFNKLKELSVSNNPEISTLFTTCVFRSLHQLQELEVSDCSLLKDIVENEQEDARDGDGTNDHNTPISPLHLKKVILSNLPNLQNIGISACYMPALDIVEITGCGHITSLFTRSALTNLQNLRSLQVSDCSLLKEIVQQEEDARDDDGTDDHNTPPISLLHLQYLILSNLPNLQNNIGIRGCYMPALVEVKVNRCGLITSLFTHSAFQNLHHLWCLNVSDCSLLKEIVMEEEDARDDDATNDQNTPPISLLHLQYTELSNLPNLQNIGISACYMPALADVDITGCGQITSLFTRSAFTNLQNLWRLKVSDCSLLEEIVEDEMDESTPGVSEKMISLPLLTDITLQRLPRLRSFSSSATYTFNMPALESITLHECPYIERFTSLRITTPSDVKIYDDNIREMTDESQGQEENEEEEEEEEEDTTKFPDPIYHG